jgi:hypothetical protein
MKELKKKSNYISGTVFRIHMTYFSGLPHPLKSFQLCNSTYYQHWKPCFFRITQATKKQNNINPDSNAIVCSRLLCGQWQSEAKDPCPIPCDDSASSTSPPLPTFVYCSTDQWRLSVTKSHEFSAQKTRGTRGTWLREFSSVTKSHEFSVQKTRGTWLREFSAQNTGRRSIC